MGGGVSKKALEDAQAEVAAARADAQRAKSELETARREAATTATRAAEDGALARAAATELEASLQREKVALEQKEAENQDLAAQNNELEEALEIMRRKQQKRVMKLAAKAFQRRGGRGVGENSIGGGMSDSGINIEISGSQLEDGSVVSDLSSQDTMMVQLTTTMENAARGDPIYDSLAAKIDRLQGRLDHEKKEKLQLSETMLAATSENIQLQQQQQVSSSAMGGLPSDYPPGPTSIVDLQGSIGTMSQATPIGFTAPVYGTYGSVSSGLAHGTTSSILGGARPNSSFGRPVVTSSPSVTLGRTLVTVGRTRDYAVIVDASSSMRLLERSPGAVSIRTSGRSRWELAREALELIVPTVVERDDDGITLYFFSSSFVKHEHVRSADEVRRHFRDYGRPKGGSCLAPVLTDAVQIWWSKEKHISTNKIGEGILAHTSEKVENRAWLQLENQPRAAEASQRAASSKGLGNLAAEELVQSIEKEEDETMKGQNEKEDETMKGQNEKEDETMKGQNERKKESCSIAQDQKEVKEIHRKEADQSAINQGAAGAKTSANAHESVRGQLEDPTTRVQQRPDIKPMTLLVVTDGAPDNRQAVEDVIRRASDALVAPDDLRILFVQVGSDVSAQRWLKSVDDALECQVDIVDTMGFEELCRTGIPFAQWVARSIVADVLM